MTVTTSLAAICAANPCPEGIRKLLKHVGKTMTEAQADTSELPVLTVLEGNGLDDAIWVLDNAVGDKRICRLFVADCAERVHHLFAAVLPDDDRPMNAIRVARDPNATDEQLAAAKTAAWAAAKTAARAAAGAAARDAARDAAQDAAWAAAGADAGADARAAAWAAAGAAHKERLRQYLIHGEAAADMPWPEPAA